MAGEVELRVMLLGAAPVTRAFMTYLGGGSTRTGAERLERDWPAYHSIFDVFDRHQCLDAYADTIMDGMDAFLVLYDVADDATQQHARDALDLVSRRKANAGAGGRPTIVILVGLKDLNASRGDAPFDTGRMLAEEFEVPHRGIALPAGDGVDDAFMELSSRSHERAAAEGKPSRSIAEVESRRRARVQSQNVGTVKHLFKEGRMQMQVSGMFFRRHWEDRYCQMVFITSNSSQAESGLERAMLIFPSEQLGAKPEKTLILTMTKEPFLHIDHLRVNNQRLRPAAASPEELAVELRQWNTAILDCLATAVTARRPSVIQGGSPAGAATELVTDAPRKLSVEGPGPPRKLSSEAPPPLVLGESPPRARSPPPEFSALTPDATESQAQATARKTSYDLDAGGSRKNSGAWARPARALPPLQATATGGSSGSQESPEMLRAPSSTSLTQPLVSPATTSGTSPLLTPHGSTAVLPASVGPTVAVVTPADGRLNTGALDDPPPPSSSSSSLNTSRVTVLDLNESRAGLPGETEATQHSEGAMATVLDTATTDESATVHSGQPDQHSASTGSNAASGAPASSAVAAAASGSGGRKSRTQIYTIQAPNVAYFTPTQFKIIRSLGRGSYGSVDLAKYGVTEYAVKWMKQGLNVQQFVHEAQQLVNLRHPNCLLMCGICVEPLAIVTEVLTGGSLFDILHASTTPLPAEHRVYILYEISKGIAFLHERSIVHKDIKSKNILLDRGLTNVKVADFGLSGAEGQALCTRLYAPPEVSLDNASVTTSADVFCFGMVIWETLARSMLPNRDHTRGGNAFVLPNLASLAPEFTACGLDALLTQCWDTDPSRRPDIFAVHTALETALEKLRASSGSSDLTAPMMSMSGGISPRGGGAGAGAAAMLLSGAGSTEMVGGTAPMG